MKKAGLDAADTRIVSAVQKHGPLSQMQGRGHRYCFIAGSLAGSVGINIF